MCVCVCGPGRGGHTKDNAVVCARCALLLLLLPLLAGVALFISPATPILLATLVLISPYIFVHFSSKRRALFIIWGQTPLPAAAPPFPPDCQTITLPPSPFAFLLPCPRVPVSPCPRVVLSLLSVGLVVAFIIDASLLLLLPPCAAPAPFQSAN